MTEPEQEEGEPIPAQTAWPEDDSEWLEVFDDEDVSWWNWEDEDPNHPIDSAETLAHCSSPAQADG